MKLIFFGAPGAGKGTIAKQLKESAGIPHISTGDIFRANIKNQTELGKKVKAILDAGELVPDELTISLVENRVKEDDCKNGYILDGFPRTIPQAEALDNMGDTVDVVLSIEVDDEEIVKRMSGRRVCEKCGTSYHTAFKKPEKEGLCNLCGGNLVIRKDDEPATVLNRLDVYHEQTEPLMDYYEKQGKLISVRGMDTVDETTKAVFKALEI
jgi:adenylate kinase